MVKKRKKLLIIIFIAITIFIILFALIIYNIWYNMIDIRGLEFYRGEEIHKVYLRDRMMYFTTTNGDGYVVGNWAFSGSRLYRNAESCHITNTDLKLPVKFFEGKIKDIYPYSGGALFITEELTVYNMVDLEVDKIAENCIYAFSGGKSNEIYVIDCNNRLMYVNDENASKLILENVAQAKQINKKLFVLFEDGILKSYDISRENQTINNETVIYSGVKSFDVRDTSLKFIDGKYITDSENTTFDNSIMVVLTKEDELYIKGTYNILMSYFKVGLPEVPEPYFISDWLKIGENVYMYSLSTMGTIILDQNKIALYYGLETKWTITPKIVNAEIEVKNVESIAMGELCFCVQTKAGILNFWGDDGQNQFCSTDGNIHVFPYDEPSVFNSKNYQYD